jgi:ISXO2-like transposase domain
MGRGIGRIRMRQIVDASAQSLVPFVLDSVEPGSVIHTDGWLGYLPLEKKSYEHVITFLRGKKKTPSESMPRVHRVISLLKRWRSSRFLLRRNTYENSVVLKLSHTSVCYPD